MAAESLELLADLIARARAAGADAADAVLISGTSLSVQRRLGKTEHVERSEGRDLGLRVFLGQQAAIVSSTTIDPSSFKDLAERAVAMARVVPEDPYRRPRRHRRAAGAGRTRSGGPEPNRSTEALVARAAAAEDAALAVAGITNSEGAEAGFGRTEAFLVTSAGFAGSSARTSHSVSATALAGTGTGMQRDYDYHSTVHLADLDDPAAIGRSAAERALARLNPDPAEDREAAGGLRSAGRRRPARPSGRRDQRRLGGARHLLPEGQARRSASSPTASRPRRSAPGAWPALPRCSTARARPPRRAPSSTTAC